MVADAFAQRSDFVFQPEESPDMVRALLEKFIQRVPGPAHRAALEACALVRFMTEPLLAAMLLMSQEAGEQAPGAYELFEWLRSLSFIDSTNEGVFPHDLARETLTIDLHWRNPDWYHKLHSRARAFYFTRLNDPRGQQHRVLLDLIYLHRHSPAIRPFFEWQLGSDVVMEPMQPADVPTLVKMASLHEGEEAGRLTTYWLERQPNGVKVWRDHAGQITGLMIVLALHRMTAEDLAADPAIGQLWSFVNRAAPLREGEAALLLRCWMAKDTYQAVSPVQSLIAVNFILQQISTQRLALSFLALAQPEFWEPVLAYTDFHPIAEATYSVGGRHYGVFGHDWRVVPPSTWVSRMTDREVNIHQIISGLPAISESLIVLSQPEFEAAVREVLRDFTNPTLLSGSPLLRSRLVLQEGGYNDQASRIEILRTQVRRAAAQLQSAPRQLKLYRALEHSYFIPAPTQEAAAELLDLPYSTYRRHLQAAVSHVTHTLWRWEVGGMES
jgi:hypothetical protein